MSDPTDENCIHFLGLPVEIQLEILRELIGDHEPIEDIEHLKRVRL